MRLVSKFKKNTLVTILVYTLTYAYTPNLFANSIQFTTAVKLFDKQSYQEAYEAFSGLVEQNYSSINYSFYLAQSAAKLNKKQEAIVAYERILILKPNHTRSKLELGKIFYELNSPAMAKHYFESAQKDNPPKTVLVNIDKYLLKISPKKSISNLTGTAILGLGFDTNIGSSPENSSWYVPTFNATFNNANNKIEHAYHQETLIINHFYNSSQKYGFAINNNFLAYNKSIPSESDYNILYLRDQPALIFNIDNLKLNAALQFSSMQYGGEAYLETYGLAPSATFNLSSNALFVGQLKLLKKNYLKTIDQSRDANYLEATIDYKKRLNHRTLWSLNGGLLKEQAESDSNLDIDFNGLFVGSSFKFQYTGSLSLLAGINLVQKNYDDKNRFFLKTRQDNYLKTSVGINQQLTKNLSFQAKLEHIQNHSNLTPYEYEKNVYLINLINRF